MTEKERLIIGRLLCLEPQFGAATIKKLLQSLALAGISLEEFWRSPRLYAPPSGLSTAKIEAVQVAREIELTAWAETLARRKIKICLSTDNDYPPLLKFIPDCPPAFFYQGDLSCLQAPTLAVVGTRKISSYGRRALAHLLSLRLKPLTIVSGLMTGVDEQAHRQALAIGAKTAAVLGYGLNQTWPASLTSLREEILAKGGVIISEYAPTAVGKAFRFPLRNRLVAGMSLATLVVEAAEQSGSLITANLALDYGREVLLVPGSIFSQFSVGTLKLWQAGATPVGSDQEIIANLLANQVTYFPANIYQEMSHLKTADNLLISHKPKVKEKKFLEPLQNQIYQSLQNQSLDSNELAELLTVEVGAIITQLSLLALAGEIKQEIDGKWQIIF